jgi:hypothetical integral membrane protein (TIGR02206 family)
MENLKYFFSYETDIPAKAGYSFFDKTHLLWMFISFALVALVVLLYKRTKLGNRRKFMIGIAIMLLLCEVVRSGWFIWLGEWSLDKSLPFQLSRIMLFVEAFAIFSNSRYLKEFTYACGLFSVAAFIAPNIFEYPLIHIHTIRYSAAHILIIAVPLIWIVGDGFRPDVRYVPKISLLLFGLAGVATILNLSFEGANYMHIHYIPEHININLKQPWFALALLGAVIGFWVLTYLPWVIYERRKKHG